MSKAASVLVFRGVGKPYTYRIPDDMDVCIGQHVDVPLGPSKCKGLVIDISDRYMGDAPIKDIIGTADKLPDIPSDLCDMIMWFATHYQCTPHKAYQTVIGNRKKRELDPTDKTAEISKAPYPLNTEQKAALSHLKQLKKYEKALLYGITSSGKTEVYMHWIETLITAGKSALILVPEIALTPQFLKIFKERFGDHIAILHSGLTPKARDIAWTELKDGYKKIAIGPRSTIFAPVQNLGAVVLDEEHDPSYKQESHPRYYTHEVAEYRCKVAQCPLLLGSATPSIESFFKAEKSEHLLPLKKRVLDRPLPKVTVIDMTEKPAQSCPLSSELETAIKDTLEKKQKVMILVNRRGYAPHISCQKCGHIYSCDTCNLSYTYHKDQYFRCHRCDIQRPITHTCPKCQKSALAFGGIAIQKIEAELSKLFPTAHISRLDRDSAKTTKMLEKILDEFRENGDILLGTQLIAKGHHIEHVTLVGVLGIDTTLNLPDFRAPERTFQLLTQVAGRAGRGEHNGEVIIQSYQAKHYAIKHASTHNFDAFYAEEVAFRQLLSYPPFSRLIHIIFSDTDPAETQKTAKRYVEKLKQSLPERVMLLGPKPAPLEKVRDHYRWHVLIKSDESDIDTVKTTIQDLSIRSKTRIIIDFDPQSIL